MVRNWRMEMLGGWNVLARKVTVRRFATQKTASLLAYLACHLDQAHPRDVLAAQFWPEADQEAGRRSLRVAPVTTSGQRSRK